MSTRDEQERRLLGMLARMQADGAIVSYKVERRADAERSLVVKLVPRAWVEHIDLAVGFVDDERELKSCATHDVYGCPLCDLEMQREEERRDEERVEREDLEP